MRNIFKSKEKLINSFSLFYVMLITLILCTQATSYSQTKISFKFFKEFELGNRNDSVEYSFGLPSAILADSAGNIFVSDDKYGSIRVFDNNGKFKYEFGENGRGPGEFIEVTSMTFMGENLLIFDFYQQRFTVFSKHGKLISTNNVPKIGEIKPDYMRYIEGYGTVLFYRKLEGLRGALNKEKDYLIHLISDDFKKITNEFVQISHTIDTEEPFERYFEGGVYRGIFTVSNNKLYLAPFFYRGKILVYDETENWDLVTTFDGYVETNRTFEGFSNYKEVIGKGLITNSARYGRLAGIMKNESLALFSKNNEDLIHIGLLEIQGKQQLYITLFSKEGVLKQHGLLRGISAGLQANGFYRRLRFYWMDKQDNIYIINYDEEAFTILKGTIAEE